MGDGLLKVDTLGGGKKKRPKSKANNKLRLSINSRAGGASRASSRGGGGFGKASRWSNEDAEAKHRPHVYMPGDEWSSIKSVEKKPGVFYMPRQKQEEIEIHYDKIKWPLYEDLIFQRKKDCSHLPYHQSKVKRMLGLNKAKKEKDDQKKEDDEES